MPIVIETWAEFHKRHGGNCIRVGGQFLFPDGARADSTGNLRSEPPTDPYQLLQAKRAYVEAKLSHESDEFHAFRSECQQQAAFAARYGSNNVPGPPENAVEQLERGRERIVKLHDELVELDRQIADTPQGRSRQERRDHEEKQRSQMTEQMRAIQSVNV
jgi:hypothetical protein